MGSDEKGARGEVGKTFWNTGVMVPDAGYLERAAPPRGLGEAIVGRDRGAAEGHAGEAMGGAVELGLSQLSVEGGVAGESEAPSRGFVRCVGIICVTNNDR